MKVWLDDRRDKPWWANVWVTDPTVCIRLIETGTVEEMSFDHDLGCDMTGYDVAKRVEELAYQGAIKRFVWRVHSANPVGAEHITAALQSASQFWASWEQGRNPANV